MNVQNLTLGEIAIALAFIAGLYASIKQIKKAIKESIEQIVSTSVKSALDAEFTTTNKKLDDVQAAVRKLDVYTTKNFLVRYLADIERGEVIFESEKQRFWEEYDHYTDELKENSYIKEWVARLKEEGKLKR